MPIHPVFSQIGEGFGRFDLAVRTSFPFPPHLIFILLLHQLIPIGAFSPEIIWREGFENLLWNIGWLPNVGPGQLKNEKLMNLN